MRNDNGVVLALLAIVAAAVIVAQIAYREGYQRGQADLHPRQPTEAERNATLMKLVLLGWRRGGGYACIASGSLAFVPFMLLAVRLGILRRVSRMALRSWEGRSWPRRSGGPIARPNKSSPKRTKTGPLPCKDPLAAEAILAHLARSGAPAPLDRQDRPPLPRPHRARLFSSRCSTGPYTVGPRARPEPTPPESWASGGSGGALNPLYRDVLARYAVALPLSGLTIPIAVDGRVYALGLYRDLAPAEFAEILALQVTLCCPAMPHQVLRRLAFNQLVTIVRLATERQDPVGVAGEAISIDPDHEIDRRMQDDHTRE